MSTISTKWGSDTIRVSANWGNASCQIAGDLDGCYRVASFQHNPRLALRKALEQCASIEGMPMHERGETIDAAMEHAIES
jgi:hypothetical protein